jgi:uncharacterized protein with HEPN domain
MKPQFRENLETVIEQGRVILSFVSGMTFEIYVSDDKTKLAVERSFEIIGEALNRAYKLDPETIDSITDYRKIISFRNILAHCYDSVEDRLVWGVIEESLPSLLSDVMNLMAVQGF